MSFQGFVTTGAQLGLDLVLIKPFRGIYFPRADGSNGLDSILAHATIEEHHTDELEITHHPVEHGASITDHAFKQPAKVVLTLGWSNSTPNGRGENLLLSGIAATGSNIGSTIVGLGQINQLALKEQMNQSRLTGVAKDQINAIYQQLLKLQRDRILFTLFTGKRSYDSMICQSLSTETDSKSANSMTVVMHCQEIILVETKTTKIAAETTKDKQNASTKDAGSVPTQQRSDPANTPLPNKKELTDAVAKANGWSQSQAAAEIDSVASNNGKGGLSFQQASSSLLKGFATPKADALNLATQFDSTVNHFYTWNGQALPPFKTQFLPGSAP